MNGTKRERLAQEVWKAYESGRRFKAGLGEHGMYEQNRRNERFYVGDQWHGARCGGERPLVRHNVIKRIGDYKTAVIGASPLSVAFSADGVPHTVELHDRAEERRRQLQAAQSNGVCPLPSADPRATPPDGDEVGLVMNALSDYFAATAHRLSLDTVKEQVLRDAYVSGTGFLYTYWDPTIETGLYADASRTAPIRGDIAVETLDVENVYFGDPNTAAVQTQPYILIAQRKQVRELREIARAHHIPEEERLLIRPDSDTGYMAGDRAADEPYETKKATVVTRLWKETVDGRTVVKAVQVCKGAIVRPPWELGVRCYPLSMFQWQQRKNCAYGDSEVTYLIPNQIAINRMITASVWAVMMMGIPMTVVNGDVVDEPVTNDPGQVLRVFGSAEDVASAVRYVDPPQFSPKFDENIQSLISNTLAQSGANEAALGDVRPDNTSAIVAVREAATMPLQPIQNRFYAFIADVARVWAEFWVMKYGVRSLKMESEDGVWYMPFEGERYRELIISVKVQVGASTLWGEAQTVATLDNLLERGVLTPVQYVSRLPHGVIPDRQSLLREWKERETSATTSEMPDEETVLRGLPQEYREKFSALSEAERAELLRAAAL